MSYLKNHPFPVEAFFEHSYVFTFAVRNKILEPLLPQPFMLDSFDDEWGFMAVAMVQTKGLRPAGWPVLLGSDFFLIGYRLFVRYVSNAGKRLRGLYILKSETNSKKMELLGNIFTHYSYSTIDIQLVRQPDTLEISSVKSGFRVLMNARETDNVSLPTDSPFSDWKQARRFAGPLPFTFSFLSATSEVLIVEGVRESWIPGPVEVLHQEFAFLDTTKFSETRLASAFVVENIPYRWKKGKLEKWKAQ